MTRGTTYKKANSSFNMPTLRRRAKKMMRKKYKKTINLTTLDKIWKEFVEYGVVRPLLEYGWVQVDDNVRFELVGKRIIDDPTASSLMSKGLMVRANGQLKEATALNRNRPGLVYKIKGADEAYKKGQLIFQACPKLKKRVSEHLKNSMQFYKIEK